jgi:hypothetical protein
VAKAVLIGAVPPVMSGRTRILAVCLSRCSTASGPSSQPTAPSSIEMSLPVRFMASTAPARRSPRGFIDNWRRQGMMGELNPV